MSDLIGTGWAFPAGVTSAGGIRMVTGPAELDGAIRMVLSTTPGERVMRPEFGCAMWEFVFAPVDGNTLGMIEKSVRDALRRWEPRIEVDSVQARASDQQGRVDIDITYTARATNDRRNLVYPFYVIPHEEPAP